MRYVKKNRFKFNILTLPVRMLKIVAIALVAAIIMLFLPWGKISSVFDSLSAFSMKTVLNCGENPVLGLFKNVRSPDRLLFMNITVLRHADESRLVNLSINKGQYEYFYEEEEEESNNGISSPQTSSQTPNLGEAKPVLKVNILPKSGEGYLTWSKVYILNSSKQKPNVSSLMRERLKLNLKEAGKGPQVLILHTHATESYNETGDVYYPAYSSRSTDNSKNVVSVGAEMMRVFETYGIKTIHATKQHDYPNYAGSYIRSLETANYYLIKYPTIKVVLDIHRDSIINGDVKYRPVVNISGHNAAQVMIVSGAGTSSSPNTHWKENLKFAVKLQDELEIKYPGITRPILMRNSRYNSHVSNGAMLLEIGTDGNSLEEALLSARYTAEVLSEIVNDNIS